MTERNLSIRLSMKDGDIVKKALLNLGDEGQKALEKVEQASAATSKGLTDVDRAVAKAESAFSQAGKAADIYQQASQRLNEQQKQGIITAAQHQGMMAELDKRFRQAATAARQVELANNAAKNSQSASSKAVMEATEAYRKLQQNTETYRAAAKSLEETYRSGAITAREYKGIVSQLNGTFGQGTASALSFSSAFQFGAAITGVGSLAIMAHKLKEEVINSSREMQNLEAKLKAVTGGSVQAGEAMGFLQGMSQRQGIDLLRLTDTYGRLLPAVDNNIISMQEMRNLMALTNDAAKAFTLSTSQQEAMMYGLSQVMGSATVTMEDLRQFTDQMPGSFAKLEKAMGLASGGLKDLISKGQTTSRDVFPAIIKMMQENEGAAEKMASTYDGAMVKMENSSRTAFDKIGKDFHVLDMITGAINGLTRAMDAYSGSVANLSKAELNDKANEVAAQIAEKRKDIENITNPQGTLGAIGAALDKLNPGGNRKLDKLKEDLAELEKEALKVANASLAAGAAANNHGKALAVESQASKDTKKATAELTKEHEENLKKYGAAADNYGKSATQLALETEQKYRATDSYKKLTAATDDNSKAQVKASDALVAQLEKAIALDKAKKAETAAKKDNKNAIMEYIAKLQEETKQSAESGKQAEISKALWEAQNIAKREHITLTAANIASITKETAERYDNTEAAKKQKQAEQELAQAIQKAADKRQEEAKKAQEAFEKPFIQAGEDIQRKFGDTFTGILENGKFNFEELADSGKHAMFQMAGEVAAALVFKPVIQPVITQAMGMFSPASGGSTSPIGGLSSFGNIGSLAGVGSAINSYGAKFGFSSGLEAVRPASDFMGPMPMAQGSMFGTTTLMGALGAAGMGAAIGGMNLFGGNGTGSTIGGAVGGLAGLPFGPLGSLAGSAIGSGIGGLFGPGKAVSAAEFAGLVGANDNLGSLTYGAKNGDINQAKGLSATLGTTLAQLVANGIDIANENIRGAINSKSGNRFETLGQQFGFNPEDAESVAAAIARVSVELAKAGNNSGSLATALQHIQTDGRKAEDILSDLNFAAAYDQLDKIQGPVSQYTAQMEALKKQYQDMIPVAERLGLATEKVTKAQENATKAMQDSFLKPISAAILEMTDPLAAQIQAEQERYAAQLRDAEALGVATSEVERLHYLKMQQLATQAGYFQQQILANDNDIRQQQAAIAETLANRYRAVSDTIKKTLSELSYGGLSTLTTKQKKEAAEAEAESLYKNAMLGNVDAQEQFADAVKNFLAFDQQLQGSGGTYAEDFARMQDMLKEVGSNAERQIPIQERIYNANTAQLSALQAISNNTAGVTSAISDLSKTLLDSYFKNNPTNSGGLFSDASLLPAGKPLSYLDEMTAQGVTVRQYHTFGRQVGYTGEYGLGGFDAWARANPDKAAAFNQMLVSAGGTPRQFENGGLTPKNQFFTVGERGKTELMFSGDSHTVYSAEQSRKLLEGAGGGNNQLLQQIETLNQKIDALIRITAASGNMNNDGLAAIEARLAAIEEKARLEAAA